MTTDKKILCPECGKRLPIDHFEGIVWPWCRQCKKVVKLDNRFSVMLR